jgi:ribosomal protein S18 acetylase RimI-like enzyme
VRASVAAERGQQTEEVLPMIALRPMTEQEYEQLADPMWEDYAQERVRNFGTTLDEERAGGARQRAALLPDGLRTPGHRFWSIVDDADWVVGNLWVFVEDDKRQAFIYNVEIGKAYRGRGYGRRTLALLEEQLKPLGMSRIALNVFGDNAIAQHLYEKAGYRTVAISMQKEL